MCRYFMFNWPLGYFVAVFCDTDLYQISTYTVKMLVCLIFANDSAKIDGDEENDDPFFLFCFSALFI